jgi:thermostable 8-oxoguanine DNA glycosylase
MINASNITNFKQSEPELPDSLIFWVLAAGKNGTRAAKITNEIVKQHSRPIFKALRDYSYSDMVKLCTLHKTGCQTIKAKSLWNLVNSDLNLKKSSGADLEKIYGIGKKTARCFIIHSRADANCAGLDTHILKFLTIMGVPNVPKTTPSSDKEYTRLEKEFLTFVKKYNTTVADLDLAIWNEFKIT